jgi:streptogramin lyase
VLHNSPCAGDNTSDIAWVDGRIYQVIFSPVEQRGIYALDPLDGQVLATLPAAGASPQGLAYDGHNLWQGDLASDTIYKLDPQTGDIRGQFPAPGGTDGQPLGMGWDGQYLWIADSRGPETIWQVDTLGAVVHQIPAPGASPYGLTWGAGSVWVSDNSLSAGAPIYRLDPVTGEILASFSCPDNGGSPNGLAHDGAELWVAVNSTDLIYEVDDGLGGSAVPHAGLLAEQVTLNWARLTRSASRIELRFSLPDPGIVRITLADGTGRIAARRQGAWPAGEQDTHLDVQGLHSGFYFIRLSALGAVRSGGLILLK